MIQFEVKETSNYSLEVFLNGDLDIDGTEVINEELVPLLLDFRIVNINFNNVPFVDSSGMGLLLNLVNALKENNITVKVSHVRAEVYEVFELLQIPDIIGEDVFV